MPLQKQTIPLPLAIGQDDRTNQQVAQPGSAQLVENYSFEETGAIKKRTGFTRLSTKNDNQTADNLDTADFIADANGEVIFARKSKLYTTNDRSAQSYVEAEPVGSYCSAIFERRSIFALPSDTSTTGVGDPGRIRFEATDVAVLKTAGVIGHASIESNTFYFNRIDLNTEQVIDTFSVAGGGTSAQAAYIRVLADDTRGEFYVMFADLGSVGARIYRCTTPFGAMTLWKTFTTTSTATSFAVGDYHPDMAQTDGTGSSSPRIFLAYQSAIGNIRIENILKSTSVTGTPKNFADGGVTGLSGLTLEIDEGVADFDTGIYCAWSIDSPIEYYHAGMSLTGVFNFTNFGPAAIATTTANLGYHPIVAAWHNTANRWIIAIDNTNTTVNADVNIQIYSTNAAAAGVGAITTQGTVQGLIQTKMWKPTADEIYFLATDQETYPRTFVITINSDQRGETADLIDHYPRCVGVLARDETSAIRIVPSANHQYTGRSIPRVDVYDTKKAITSILIERASSAGSNIQPAAYLIDHDNPVLGTSARIGDSTFVMTGGASELDTYKLTESGFTITPDWEKVATPLTGGDPGGALTDGVYGVKLVYTYTDSHGDTHFSQPSLTETITLSAGTSTQTIAVTLPTDLAAGDFWPTQREGEEIKMGVAIYRTLVGGSIFFFVVEVNTNTAAFTLTESDAVVGARPLLYTTGGVLESYPAPPLRHMVANANRLFGLSAEHQARLVYTKKKAAGVGLAWPLAFSLDLASESGKATGLAVQDGRIIVFYERGIVYVQGDGPNDLGQGIFSPPQVISSDVGCCEAASIVTTSDGTFFKSERGIYILTRGLQPQFIGAPVESYNDTAIKSAFADPEKHEIRFSLKGTDDVLIYNSVAKVWSVFSGFTNLQDMKVVGSDVWWVGTDGRLALENRTDFLDFEADSCLLAKIHTPWYKLAGVEGFQRIYEFNLAGQRPISGTEVEGRVTVKVYYDYDDTVAETFNTDVTSNPDDDQLLYTFKPARQKCAAIRFDIEEALADGVTCANHPAGVTLPKWTTLTLEVGVKGGIDREATR